jgi:hypothetical protein
LSIDIRQKAARFMDKSLDMKWPVGVVDFESATFIVDGSKSLQHVQDDIETAFLWCWSIKDHLIDQLLASNSKIKKKMIEDEIDTYNSLVLCSDIANGLKHKTLKNSRSNKYAKLSVIQNILINKETISLIQKLDGQYFITPSNGDCVKVKASILSQVDEYLSDAYECLSKSLEAWSEISSKFSNT